MTNPNKNHGRWVSDGLPWVETSHVCCQGKSVLCVSPHGGREQKARMWIPPDSAYGFLPYYIHAINLSPEYNSMPRLMSPSSESTKVEAGLREP